MTPSAYLALGLLVVITMLVVDDFIYCRRKGMDFRAWVRHLNGDDR